MADSETIDCNNDCLFGFQIDSNLLVVYSFQLLLQEELLQGTMLQGRALRYDLTK